MVLICFQRAPHTTWHSTTVVITEYSHTLTTATSTFYTTTSTVSASPTATFYPACGPNNQLSTLPNGRPISSINIRSPNYQFSEVFAATQYDCCVACITSPICDVAIYNLENDNCGRAGQCFQINQNGQCPQRFPFIQATFDRRCPGTIGISNGPCGKVGF